MREEHLKRDIIVPLIMFIYMLNTSWLSVMYIIACFCSILLLPVIAIKIDDIKVPSKVRQGNDVKLKCFYKLDNKTNERLLSLKWIFSGREFYRYSPSSKKVFPVLGLQVNVSVNN